MASNKKLDELLKESIATYQEYEQSGKEPSKGMNAAFDRAIMAQTYYHLTKTDAKLALLKFLSLHPLTAHALHVKFQENRIRFKDGPMGIVITFLDDLVSEGLIERVPSQGEFGPTVNYRITPQGRKFADQTVPQQQFAELFAAISAHA